MNLLFNKSSPSNEIRGPLKFSVATRKEISPKSLSNTFTFLKMISLALDLSHKKENPVILVTKDINFRVKCDALNIKSEDYYRDKIAENKNELYY